MADRTYKITYYDPKLVGKKITKDVKELLLDNREKEYLLNELKNHFHYLPMDIQEQFLRDEILERKPYMKTNNGEG